MGKIIFILMFFSVFIFAQEVRLLHTKVSSANWGESIKLEANITNAHLVNYIVVNYKTDLEQHYSQIEMNPAEGKFVAEIPPTNDNYTKISYYIEIFDANEKVATTFASKKDPQIIKVEKTTDVDGNNLNAVTIQTKDKDVKFKTTSEDFEVYITGLEALQNIKVTTASKFAQKASDAPATVYVITEEMIKSRGYTNLEEVLDDIPGVEIQKKSTAEYENYVTVRGLAGNDKLVMLMDGFKISPTDNTPMAIGTNYPLIGVKQVEVIIGPASALYGPDAVNGIINIITKTGKDVKGLEVKTSYGNATTTLNEFTGGFDINDVSFMLTGHIYHSDEPNFSDIYKKEYEWYHNEYKKTGTVLISPFVKVPLTLDEIESFRNPTDSYSIHGKLNFKDVEFGYYLSTEGHSTSLGGKPEYNIYADDAIYKTTIQTFYGKHQYKSANEKFLMNTSLWYGSYQVEPETLFLNQFTSYVRGYKYAFGRTLKAEEQITYSFTNRYILVGGVSFDVNNSLPESSDLPRKYDPNKSADEQKIEYPGTNIKDRDGNDLTIYEDFYYLEYNNIGTYLQFQATPINAVQFTLGSRFDYNSRYKESFNPRAGLVITPHEKIKAKLMYGQAFLSPSPFYSYQHYGSFVRRGEDGSQVFDEASTVGLMGYYWRIINPDLKPEKLSNFEGSLILSITNNISLTFNGYYQKLTNMIISQDNPSSGGVDTWHTDFKNIPVATLAERINKGTATTYGGSARLDMLFNLGASSNIMPYITYSYSNGNINDLLLTYSAKHTVKGGIDAKIDKLFVSTRFNYRGRTYHNYMIDNNIANKILAKPSDYGKSEYDDLSSDPYFIVNLNARYENVFNSELFNISVFFNIYNLFNTKHYNVGLAGEEGFFATPQDTFRFLGGLIYKW